MEVDVGARLQRLEAVGDLQQRLEVAFERKREDPVDLHARVQNLESTTAGRLQALSTEFQNNVGGLVSSLLQQVERGLSALEEAAAQQAQQTEQALQGLTQKVEESIQNSANEIGDAAIEAVLRQADSSLARRGIFRNPSANTVIRQVSTARPDNAMPVTMTAQGRASSPPVHRAMSPTLSMSSLRAENSYQVQTVVRAASPGVVPHDPMMAAMVSPRADFRPAVRGRSSEPRQATGELMPVAISLSGTTSPPAAQRPQIKRIQQSPRGPNESWLHRPPAALRQIQGYPTQPA